MTDGSTRVLRLDHRPERLSEWLRGLWTHRDVLVALAKQDFRARYKRASLGTLWAVGVPVLQAVVMVFVFSRLGTFASGDFSYGIYVLAGMVAWFYTSTVVTTATTSIVDATHLTEKVWFPRAVPALVPAVANLITLGVSLGVVIIAMPLLGEPYTVRLALVVPATALLVTFSAALSLVLSAAYVYFRDVKFMVQAAMLMWFYVTPIVYAPNALEGVGRWLDLNPLSGIVGMFQRAAVDAPVPTARALTVSVVSTLVLLVIGIVVHRRYDRLFVDQL